MKTRTALVACLFAALIGCSATTEEPDKSAKQYVNLSTGEVEQFADGDSVPPGYGECTEQGCPEPYPCTEIDPDSCTVRSDCTVGYSPGCNPDEEDCTVAGCAAASPDVCDPSECPDEISTIAMICDDGSVATPVCERVADGACNYVHRCQSDECGPEDCGAIPEIAMICEDGSMALPVCETTSAGVCGYGFVCNDDVVVSPSCELSECGAAPAIAMICPNGQAAEMVCEPGPAEACGWAFDCSTTVQCTPDDCGANNFMGHVCEDGAEAIVECMATREGLCEWTPVCPL